VTCKYLKQEYKVKTKVISVKFELLRPEQISGGFQDLLLALEL
jgi:hypothetical protein